MNELIAVKSGYYFAMVPAGYLKNVNLEQTKTMVEMPNQKNGCLTLHRGSTYADAKRIDSIIDDNQFPVYEIDKFTK